MLHAAEDEVQVVAVVSKELRRIRLQIPWPLCTVVSWSAVGAELGTLGALWYADVAEARFLFVMGSVLFHTLNRGLIGAAFAGQPVACSL